MPSSIEGGAGESVRQVRSKVCSYDINQMIMFHKELRKETLSRGWYQ